MYILAQVFILPLVGGKTLDKFLRQTSKQGHHCPTSNQTILCTHLLDITLFYPLRRHLSPAWPASSFVWFCTDFPNGLPASTVPLWNPFSTVEPHAHAYPHLKPFMIFPSSLGWNRSPLACEDLHGQIYLHSPIFPPSAPHSEF